MTILRGKRGGGGTLPRRRAAPETNIIQAPELLQRLRETLGVRQSHFLPALNEGVQCVILLEDMTGKSGSTLQPAFAGGTPLAGDGGTRASSAILFNPESSGIKVRVRSIVATPQIASGIPTFLVVTTAFMTGPPAPADFGTTVTEFFQNHTYSHLGWPTLTTIRSPVAVMLTGRSAPLGSRHTFRVRDVATGGQFSEHPITFEDYVLGPSMACVVQLTSIQLTDTLGSVSFQWTEEPLTRGNQ